MFKFQKEPPRYTGYKPKPEPAPEPDPEGPYKPFDTSGYTGDGLRMAKIVNQTGRYTYDENSPLWQPRNRAKRDELFTLSQLANEYLQEDLPAGRLIDRLEGIIRDLENQKP